MNVRTEFRFSALGLSLGANPVFRTFWFVQRLRVGLSAHRRRVSIRPKAERFARRRRSACVIARRRRVSIRPKVLLAIGELFVRAQSACSQARSAYVIARRRRGLCPCGTKTSTPTAMVRHGRTWWNDGEAWWDIVG